MSGVQCEDLYKRFRVLATVIAFLLIVTKPRHVVHVIVSTLLWHHDLVDQAQRYT